MTNLRAGSLVRIRGNYFGGGAAIQRHPSILGSLAAPPKFSPELVQVGLLAGYSRTSSVDRALNCGDGGPVSSSRRKIVSSIKA